MVKARTRKSIVDLYLQKLVDADHDQARAFLDENKVSQGTMVRGSFRYGYGEYGSVERDGPGRACATVESHTASIRSRANGATSLELYGSRATLVVLVL